MTAKIFRIFNTLIIISAFAVLLNSCDKAESLFLTDSEKLMKDLKGSWELVSIRNQVLYSNDGGNNYYAGPDTTYPATGRLDISSIDKGDYTGTLTITYSTINETHSINGSAYKDSFETLWIITDNQEDIQSMILFNPPASYLEGWLDERDDNHILLRVSEGSWDYSMHVNRFFRFEKR